MGFERFVAGRYLWSKRREVFISISTILAVLAVSVSVMVLDTVLSIMTGFEKELKSKLIDSSAHILIRKYGEHVDSWQEASELAEGVQGVVSAEPYTHNQVLVSVSERGSRGIVLRGISPDPSVSPRGHANLSKMLLNRDSLGSLLSQSDALPGMIIGKELMEVYGLKEGQAVTVLSPQLTSTPRGLAPRIKRFKIVGVYKSGLIEYEKNLAYVSLEEAQGFFRLGNNVTGIEVTVEDSEQAPEISAEISRVLPEIDYGFFTSDWTEQNSALWEALELEKRVYFLVLLLVILIASFTIISTLVMLVMEKKKDIAVLKSLGASSRSILRIILFQGCTIGAIGTVLGTIMGAGLCLGLDYYGFPINEKVFSMSQVPVHMTAQNFTLTAILAFIITSLSGIYPAYRAASIDPAKILRFE